MLFNLSGSMLNYTAHCILSILHDVRGKYNGTTSSFASLNSLLLVSRKLAEEKRGRSGI